MNNATTTLPPGAVFSYDYRPKGIHGKVKAVRELGDQLERVSNLVDSVNGKPLIIEWEVKRNGD